MRLANLDKSVPFYLFDVIIFVGYRVNKIDMHKYVLDGELKQESLCSFFEHSASDGKNYTVQYYNEVGLGLLLLNSTTEESSAVRKEGQE